MSISCTQLIFSPIPSEERKSCWRTTLNFTPNQSFLDSTILTDGQVTDVTWWGTKNGPASATVNEWNLISQMIPHSGPLHFRDLFQFSDPIYFPEVRVQVWVRDASYVQIGLAPSAKKLTLSTGNKTFTALVYIRPEAVMTGMEYDIHCEHHHGKYIIQSDLGAIWSGLKVVDCTDYTGIHCPAPPEQEEEEPRVKVWSNKQQRGDYRQHHRGNSGEKQGNHLGQNSQGGTVQQRQGRGQQRGGKTRA